VTNPIPLPNPLFNPVLQLPASRQVALSPQSLIDYAKDPCISHHPPNMWDRCLYQEAELWWAIQCCGGLAETCRRVEGPRYEVPPWNVMPPQGRRFQYINTIALPGNVGVDNVVINFQVPVGYDGIIKALVNRFLGVGFVEGSGDLAWRVRLSRRFAYDFGNILTSLGDLTSPCQMRSGGVQIFSHQTIQYLVNLGPLAAAHLDPNGRILCAISGWFWPRP
jgi:hypothetical protein